MHEQDMDEQQGIYELPGDLPSTPSTCSDSTFSFDSLTPAPLSVARPPRVNFSRPRPALAGSFSSGARFSSYQSTEREPAPDLVSSPLPRAPPLHIHRPYRTSIDSNDSAAPPPTASTHSDSSHSSYYQQAGTATWIYKPYFAHSPLSTTPQPSDASSIGTSSLADRLEDAADDTADDTASQAESTSTGYTSVSDFAFEGQLGYLPPAQDFAAQERQRQRWQQPLRLHPRVGPVAVDPPPPAPSTASAGSRQGSAGSIETLHGAHSARAATSVPNSSQDDSGVSSPSRRRLLLFRSRDSARTSSSSSSSGHSGPATLPPSSSTKTTTTTTTQQAPPAIPMRLPRIIKRTSVDQMSVHVNPHQSDGMSDAGSAEGGVGGAGGGAGGGGPGGEWTSSDFDTSGLSVEKIHKLKKKGVNPALYAEMKQARKGRKVGTLTANTFLG